MVASYQALQLLLLAEDIMPAHAEELVALLFAQGNLARKDLERRGPVRQVPPESHQQEVVIFDSQWFSPTLASRLKCGNPPVVYRRDSESRPGGRHLGVVRVHWGRRSKES